MTENKYREWTNQDVREWEREIDRAIKSFRLQIFSYLFAFKNRRYWISLKMINDLSYHWFESKKIHENKFFNQEATEIEPLKKKGQTYQNHHWWRNTMDKTLSWLCFSKIRTCQKTKGRRRQVWKGGRRAGKGKNGV